MGATLCARRAAGADHLDGRVARPQQPLPQVTRVSRCRCAVVVRFACIVAFAFGTRHPAAVAVCVLLSPAQYGSCSSKQTLMRASRGMRACRFASLYIEDAELQSRMPWPGAWSHATVRQLCVCVHCERIRIRQPAQRLGTWSCTAACAGCQHAHVAAACDCAACARMHLCVCVVLRAAPCAVVAWASFELLLG